MNRMILAGILIPFAGTTLGSAMVFFMRKEMNEKVQKLLLGFASGVMIAASVWSLLIPAIEMAEQEKTIAWIPASVGFLLGMGFLLLLDTITPHLHFTEDEPEGIPSHLKKTTMLVLAVTLHNIPEGMAVGVTFAGVLTENTTMSMTGAFALAIGIAIQNFPEGAIISMPLQSQEISKTRAFVYGTLSGIVEPVGAFLTILLTGLVVPLLPYLLSFAAGAMIYVVVEELIPEAQSGEHSNISTIADNFVSKNVDLICAIATPSAMSAYNSCLDSEIPVVYTAVSDPVGAGLADEEGNSVGNITGTSDKLPVEEQLKMIRDLMPDAKKIGILYTTSEANSVSTIKEYKELAENYDFEIVDSGINTVADVEMAAKDLASKVDCISNLTDNTVVSALQTVIAAADEKNIPVFGSEIEQVKIGCLASMGIDYIALGKQTGEMAAKILKGESKAEEMPYEVCSGASFYVNTAVADKLNFELDQATVDGAAEVFDEITVE